MHGMQQNNIRQHVRPQVYGMQQFLPGTQIQNDNACVYILVSPRVSLPTQSSVQVNCPALSKPYPLRMIEHAKAMLQQFQDFEA